MYNFACMKKFIFTAIFTVLSVVAFSQAKKDLNVSEFEKGLKGKDIQLVDVRTPAEYKEGHLKGAILADWKNQEEFAAAMKKLDPKKPVYVYCLAGVRSENAAQWLVKNGFTQVAGLTGGIKAWTDEGKPVVKND